MHLLIPLITFLSLAGPLSADGPMAAKDATARRVFDDVVRAIGDGRPAPALRLQSADGGDMAVAWYNASARELVLDERAYDVCTGFGADSLAALAVLLGHELAHCYRDHDWVGDFGNGYADLTVARRLAATAQAETSVLRLETEADHFGGFYGYMAGYNTLGVAPRLLAAVYEEFELGEDMPGYPALEERRDMALRAEELLAGLVPVFEAGQLLLAIGHHDEAGACFDHIATTFPSREILNNSGVARALMAIDLFTAAELPFALPLEIDADTRLSQGRTRTGSPADAARQRRDLLAIARQRFEAAAGRDPDYATALVNLSCVAVLEDELDQAVVHAEAAAKLAVARDELQTTANALVARGVARALGGRGESSLAAADFREAAAGNPALAALNLAVLNGDRTAGRRRGAEKTSPQIERLVGPGTEAFDQITGAPEQSISVPRGSRSALLLLAGSVDGWPGLVVDTGHDITALLSSPIDGGRTARGLHRGAGRAEVTAAYGEPARVLASRQHTAQVYEDARILFRTDLDDRVSGWTLFFHETEFYEPVLTAPSSADRRVALVVGNDAYEDVPLANAVNDARAMTEALRRYRFEVIPLINADRGEMVRAIRQFGVALEGADVGLFYYAGHGVEVEGLNYLVPVGADAAAADEVPQECVAVNRLLGKMEAAANDVNVIILDACRNNPYAGRYRSARGGGLASVNPPDGSFVAFATAPGQVAEDGTGGNGLFTASILRHLGTPGQDVAALFTQVARDVSEATEKRQLPWRNSSLTAPFYFVPPADGGPQIAMGYARTPPRPEDRRARPPAARTDDEVLVGDLGIYLDRYEVTAAQFAAFLREFGNREEDGAAWLDVGDPEGLVIEGPDGFAPRAGYERHPVVSVTWYGARAYCEAHRKRLPTAAEWRAAALGDGARRYPWGDEPPGAGEAYRANYHQGALPEDGYAGTAPVGSFPEGVSPDGLYDVAGNVWEWIDADDGDRRQLMGGSWYTDAAQLGGEYWRDAALPTGDTGFRCARSR